MVNLDFGDFLIYFSTFIGLFTSIYFIMILFEQRKNLYFGDSTKFPFVSICVPCYNEEKTVAKTLRSLSKLKYPLNRFEILVVDDGSRDKTVKKVESFMKLHPAVNIKIFKKKNGGKYTAVNLALKHAKGEFFGNLDADSFVDDMALSKIMRVFETNKKVVAVTPSMKIYEPKGVLRRVQHIEYLFGIFLRKVFAGLGSIHVTPGPFSFYRMSFFKKYGVFRKAHHTEDIELALRAQLNHEVIDNAVDAFVYTVGPNDFKTLWNQRIRWYYGFIANIRDYKELFSKNHGNLGLLMLPSSFISVLITVMVLFYTSFMLVKHSINSFLNWAALNFRLVSPRFDFDPFFINVQPTAILAIITLSFAILMIVISKRLGAEKKSILYSYILFIFIYPILYPLWWLASLWRFIIGKKTVWGHKSDV